MDFGEWSQNVVTVAERNKKHFEIQAHVSKVSVPRFEWKCGEQNLKFLRPSQVESFRFHQLPVYLDFIHKMITANLKFTLQKQRLLSPAKVVFFLRSWSSAVDQDQSFPTEKNLLFSEEVKNTLEPESDYWPIWSITEVETSWRSSVTFNRWWRTGAVSNPEPQLHVILQTTSRGSAGFYHQQLSIAVPADTGGAKLRPVARTGTSFSPTGPTLYQSVIKQLDRLHLSTDSALFLVLDGSKSWTLWTFRDSFGCNFNQISVIHFLLTLRQRYVLILTGSSVTF